MRVLHIPAQDPAIAALLVLDRKFSYKVNNDNFTTPYVARRGKRP